MKTRLNGTPALAFAGSLVICFSLFSRSPAQAGVANEDADEVYTRITDLLHEYRTIPPIAGKGLDIEEMEKVFREVFDLIDKNRDGRITTEELIAYINELYMLALNECLTREKLEKCFAELEPISDEIERLATFPQDKVILEFDAWLRFIKKGDRNRDGYLDCKELEKMGLDCADIPWIFGGAQQTGSGSAGGDSN